MRGHRYLGGESGHTFHHGGGGGGDGVCVCVCVARGSVHYRTHRISPQRCSVRVFMISRQQFSVGVLNETNISK